MLQRGKESKKRLKVVDDIRTGEYKKTKNKHGAETVGDNGIQNLPIYREPWVNIVVNMFNFLTMFIRQQPIFRVKKTVCGILMLP